MNNTWCRIVVCVFFCMASSASVASAQETDFVLVALEQLRDRMERDDKGTLDEFVADVSAASGLSATASRDSLVSLLRDLKTHCKKSTALGEQLFALHGEHFSEREAKAYLVRVVGMAGDLLKKEENVGLEPLIARAANKSKLLKFQALDYTAALLVPFVGLPVVEEPAKEESAANALAVPIRVLVKTRNSGDLQAFLDQGLILSGRSGHRLIDIDDMINDLVFSKIFKATSSQNTKKEILLAMHESIRPALLDELKQFDRLHWTTDIASVKDVRYTLDYLADWYSFGKDNDQQQFKLQTSVQLVMKDVLEDKELLNKWLVVNAIFKMDEKPILDDFYQEVARTVAQEVFDCLLGNAHIRR
ncbi:MAG: hypothetical protein OXE49_07640 [Gemmatimonadetes bacterium]|nr:hypothetical protein [Gemmatimonadota bacterium]